MVKSNREIIKKEIPAQKQLKKGKAKLVEPEIKQQVDEEMLQLQKQLEEEAAFYNGLMSKGITAEEITKLRDAEINSCEVLMNYTTQNSKIKGLTEARLYKICKTALEAGKVSGINRLLKQTAYAKKQNFVVVKNLAKGVTERDLMLHFRLISGFKDAEIRKGKSYGFVYFVTRNDAKRAAEIMNGELIRGQMISVKLDVAAEGSSRD